MSYGPSSCKESAMTERPSTQTKLSAQETHVGHGSDLQLPTLRPIGPKWRVWVGGLWFLRDTFSRDSCSLWP